MKTGQSALLKCIRNYSFVRQTLHCENCFSLRTKNKKAKYHKYRIQYASIAILLLLLFLSTCFDPIKAFYKTHRSRKPVKKSINVCISSESKVTTSTYRAGK